jgi:mannobiose 2-epimerase
MDIDLTAYKKAMEQELASILSFWMQYTPDEINGGFIGQIDFNNKIIAEAPKGAVLNARILWTFSAAYHLTGNKEYLDIAIRAFNYINKYFIDKEYGGVYWTVDEKGAPFDTKKQVYAQAFTMYAFSEFYKATKENLALELAEQLFDLVIRYSYDPVYGGYTEAFTKEWLPLNDLRLSDKDANEKKSMNTNLHVLEAFTNLYRVWQHGPLKKRIQELIGNFLHHIINPSTHQQYLFFGENWEPRSETISFGHDIETAWLLQEAAETIEVDELIKMTKAIAIGMSEAVKTGLGEDGGIWYEYDPQNNHLVKEKHHWPQAEAMVGFFNAYQNTSDTDYLLHSLASWKFIQEHILDKEHGEWFWGVKENDELMQEDKVGLWKCPYHNSRACMQIIKRIKMLQQQPGS